MKFLHDFAITCDTNLLPAIRVPPFLGARRAHTGRLYFTVDGGHVVILARRAVGRMFVFRAAHIFTNSARETVAHAWLVF